ncbi:hypothetical protein TL16_g13059 [Triparma laevis f. inornata]|uniref:Uncharacterized protein n=2 Tax=Triparma laevis TaxID=1534972 RepID=A0A9W6ZXQ4_9STRA|nr:hypothetical protein TrLO_g9712 [Triparma laevis f. longispina]GMH95022.1 hypothetical protein TL16_g13059 [Triparma laevis f. inornata]
MDSEYLKSTVGPAMTSAMASLVVEQPNDAVEYLGTYLLSYVKAKEMEASKLEAEKKMAQLLKEQAEAKAIEDEKAREAAAYKAVRDKEESDLSDALTESTDIASLYGKVVALVQSRTNATGVYLGRKETTDAGVNQIQYLSSTQDVMNGKVLKGVPEGEEEGAEGVTWPIFVSSEIEETVTDTETGEESTVTKTVFPEDVTVANIVRDPAVKCFGLPKLGSYVAVPVRYNSCLHENGIEDAPPPPEPVAADDVDPDAPPAEPEVVEAPPKFSPVNVVSEFIIGFDSVGQGREFTEEEKAFAKAWALKLSEASAAAELKLWNAEIALLETMAGGEGDAAAGIASAKEAAAAGIGEKVTALGEANEDEKAYKEVSFRAAAALEVVGGVKDAVLGLGALSVPPKGETIKTLTAVCMLAGVEKARYTDMLTGKVSWGLLKAQLTEGLVEKMAVDPAGVTGDAAEGIKGVVEGLDEASIPFNHILATSSVVGSLLSWCNATLADVEAYAAWQVKVEEAKAAALEAAGGEGGE